MSTTTSPTSTRRPARDRPCALDAARRLRRDRRGVGRPPRARHPGRAADLRRRSPTVCRRSPIGCAPAASAPATASACASPAAPPSSTSPSSACSRPAPRTSRSTPTTPPPAPSRSSPTPASAPRSATSCDLHVARHAGRPRRPPRPRRRRLDHLHLGLDGRAEGRRRDPPRRGRVPRRRGGAVAGAIRRTACSPACRSRSTPAARRCGWRGPTARRSCPRRARWCAPASSSARGWPSGRSRSSRPCRRWPRSGTTRRSRRCAC